MAFYDHYRPTPLDDWLKDVEHKLKFQWNDCPKVPVVTPEKVAAAEARRAAEMIDLLKRPVDDVLTWP